MSNRTAIVKKDETDIETTRQRPSARPRVDIFENDEEILIYADMPGVEKEKVHVNIDNGRLSLSGERKMELSGAGRWEEFGDVDFSRIFSVPQSIDVGKVNAELQDGVLRLHLPKSEAAKPRQIEINVA